MIKRKEKAIKLQDDAMLDLDSDDDDDESFMSFLAHMGMGGQGRGRGAMAMRSSSVGNDDDDGNHEGRSSVLSENRATIHVARARLFSITNFVLGSALYLVLAVWDYQWAKMVQPWPEDVLESFKNDDIVYNNYRLELLYYGTAEAVEESEVGGRATRAIRTNRVRFPMLEREVGSARRRGTRAREGRDILASIDNLNGGILPADDMPPAVATEGGAPQALDEREGSLPPPPSSSQVETLHWEDLTLGYKLGYVALGYNETLWNSGGSVPADELTWEELSDAHRTVLIIMGLGQEVWDAASPGEHFPSQPEAPLSESTASLEVDAAGVMEVDSSVADDDIASSVDAPSNETDSVEMPAAIDPAADVALAPAIAAYYDEYWEDLPSKIQAAFGILGYNETTWNGGITPETFLLYWDEVTPEQREAALFIGYTKEMWDAEVDAIANGIDEISDETEVVETPTTIDPAADVSAALTPEIVAYYNEYWKDLPLEIQAAFGVLGYNETKWNGGITPETSLLYWDEITPEQREAALFIGYTKKMWDAEVDAMADPTLSPVPFDPTAFAAAGYYDDYAWDEMPPQVQDAFATLGYDKDLWDDPLGIGLKASSDGSDWATLTPDQQQAAALVGYDQQSWDAITESDAYDVLDDDTLFYICDESGWWVGRYTVVYFSASFCFVLSGLADFFWEKHFLNIFMFLGGLFGCISAIYLSNNDIASSIFDIISVHLFLLEAIKMIYEEDSLAEYSPRWMKLSLVLADTEFLLGALLDVCMAYVWLFYDSADWSMPITTLYIVHSLLWLHCSLIQLGAFFRFPQDRLYDPEKHREWTWM